MYGIVVIQTFRHNKPVACYLPCSCDISYPLYVPALCNDFPVVVRIWTTATTANNLRGRYISVSKRKISRSRTSRNAKLPNPKRLGSHIIVGGNVSLNEHVPFGLYLAHVYPPGGHVNGIKTGEIRICSRITRYLVKHHGSCIYRIVPYHRAAIAEVYPLLLRVFPKNQVAHHTHTVG